MPERISAAKYAELATLFFIHGMAMAMWFVPMSTVLDAYGVREIKPYAYATSGLAAFLSPLIFGAMADRHLGAVRVMRWLSLAVAAATMIATTCLDLHANKWIILASIQLVALFYSPTWSIVAAIVLSELSDARRQYGPIRALATLGWMAGCWLVSWMNADSSTLAGHGTVLVWLLLAAFTLFLPGRVPARREKMRNMREGFGWDALALLKDPHHRTVFITAALATIPLAAFYPFTPPHLISFGLNHTSAWMTLGQVTEIIAMFSLSALLHRWPLKWIFAAGLGSALLRYIFCALDSKAWVLLGVSLHGFAYTFFFVTAPVYLDGQVDPKWRARAQALMSLMTSGLGNLTGYLTCGWWFQACERGGQMQWSLFWGGLAVAVAAVLGYFLTTYDSPPQTRPHINATHA